MENNRNSCNCVRQCPCYPHCDRMMEQLEETQQMEQRTATAGYLDAPMTDEDERDWQKLKEMYPDMAKIILSEVERVCDSLEYEGSMMFDTIPDKERMRKMTADIYEKVKNRYPIEEGPDRDEMLVMNRESRRRYPPRQNWLNDFIQVLLFQEIHQRRCRHRRCRR